MGMVFIHNPPSAKVSMDVAILGRLHALCQLVSISTNESFEVHKMAAQNWAYTQFVALPQSHQCMVY